VTERAKNRRFFPETHRRSPSIPASRASRKFFRPTGKPVQFQNLSVSRVENGKIVQYNSEVGYLSVFMQLGVLPVKRGGALSPG
jgi:SnoaL-like polyketide cyclase.